METIYKIRRLSDGLYSAGGSTPTFTKNGKIWKTLTAVKLHIHSALGHGYNRYGMYQYPNLKSIYKDCVLVEYNILEIGTANVMNLIESIHEQLDERNIEREKRHIVWQRKQLKKDLEDINKKLEQMENEDA